MYEIYRRAAISVTVWHVYQLTSVLRRVIYIYNSLGTDPAFIGTVHVFLTLIKVESN